MQEMHASQEYPAFKKDNVSILCRCCLLLTIYVYDSLISSAKSKCLCHLLRVSDL